MKGRVKWIVAVILAVLAVLFAWAYARPLDAHVLTRELQLRFAGVRRVKAATLAAWEKDNCAPGAECRCAALVHGLGDTALTWDLLLKEAPAGWKVLAVELPGSEGSALPPYYGLRAQAKLVRAALKERCDKWTVAGNSLGGWIASWVAIQWPEGVSDLVLVSAGGVQDPSGATEAAGRLLADPTPEGLAAFEPKLRFKPREVPPRVLRSVAAKIRERPARETVLAITTEDFLDRSLKKVKAPARLVWGASDGVTPLSVGERFHKLLPGSSLQVIPECGHVPQRECPEPVKKAVFQP